MQSRINSYTIHQRSEESREGHEVNSEVAVFILAKGNTMFPFIVVSSRVAEIRLSWKFSTVLLFCPNWVANIQIYYEYLAEWDEVSEGMSCEWASRIQFVSIEHNALKSLPRSMEEGEEEINTVQVASFTLAA